MKQLLIFDAFAVSNFEIQYTLNLLADENLTSNKKLKYAWMLLSGIVSKKKGKTEISFS